WLYRLRNRVGFRRKMTRLRGIKTVDAFHMEMHCVSEDKIRELLSGWPVRIIDVKLTNSSMAGFNGNLEFLDREPDRGFISKQYCLIKEPFAAAPQNQQPAEAGGGS